jgi:hypothetical protein
MPSLIVCSSATVDWCSSPTPRSAGPDGAVGRLAGDAVAQRLVVVRLRALRRALRRRRRGVLGLRGGRVAPGGLRARVELAEPVFEHLQDVESVGVGTLVR